MSDTLKKVAEGEYTLGNYSITHENGEWLLVPVKAVYGKSTWLTNTIRCDNRDDAFRIALVFTGEDLVNQTMREMMTLVVSERKEKNA